MVHLNKQCIPFGSYTKLLPHNHSPFHILQKTIDNIIDLPSDWRIENAFNVAENPPDDAAIIEVNSGSNFVE